MSRFSVIAFGSIKADWPDYQIGMANNKGFYKGYDYEVIHKPTGTVKTGHIRKDATVAAEVTLVKAIKEIETELAAS